MADEFDQFPDVPGTAPAAVAVADEFADFPDAAAPAVPPPAVAPAAPPQPNTWGQAVKNVGETVLQVAGGIPATIAGDVAGLGALAYDSAANLVMHPFRGTQPSAYADPTKVRQNVTDFFSYHPSNPKALEESPTNKLVSFPGKVLQGAGDELAYYAEKTGIPGAEHVARALPQVGAAAFGVRAGVGPKFNTKPYGGTGRMSVPQESPGVPRAPEPPTPEQAAVKKATDAGYKLSPSQVGNKVGATAEGMSGQAASERLLSKKNATVTDSLAKKALGIGNDEHLTPAKITELKVKANKAYNDVAKTGARKTSDEFRKEVGGINNRTGAGSFPDDTPPAVEKLKADYAKVSGFTAEDAVAKIRKLRKDATANYKTRDPEKMALGDAQRKVADALDNELERHVRDIGRPDLVENYKAARVQLAKLHTVEDALQGTNVSAKKIWQQWQRGVPLSGELRAIAETYDSFQHVLQDVSKIRGKHPFTVVDALVAAGASGAAGLSANPALLAAVAARPVTRSFLASDFYQRNFVAPKGPKGPVATKPSASAKASKVAPVTAAPQRERRAR